MNIMTEAEILNYITPAQLEYLKQFIDRELNTQGGEGKRYITNDISLADVMLPGEATPGCYDLIIKPSEQHKKVGILHMLFGELVDDSVAGGNWFYGSVVNGLPVPKPIESDSIMLIIKTRPSWDFDKWILKEDRTKQPAKVATSKKKSSPDAKDIEAKERAELARLKAKYET